ncbi:MAG: hypothetical protein [Wufeng shrew rhabdovirus 7]|nr:MAG: hypothetical protein [Wufeng shrew rhabdovirus 7]
MSFWDELRENLAKSTTESGSSTPSTSTGLIRSSSTDTMQCDDCSVPWMVAGASAGIAAISLAYTIYEKCSSRCGSRTSLSRVQEEEKEREEEEERKERERLMAQLKAEEEEQERQLQDRLRKAEMRSREVLERATRWAESYHNDKSEDHPGSIPTYGPLTEDYESLP